MPTGDKDLVMMSRAQYNHLCRLIDSLRKANMQLESKVHKLLIEREAPKEFA